MVDPIANRIHVSFVQAHETLYPTDTPYEAFEFVAKLRLPKSERTPEKVEERVNRALEQLRLVGCKDTYIGSVTLKGLSSGEKKRTSVGLELIPDTTAIFLDEPTTGLDSVTAYEIIELLEDIARTKNVCVVTVLHQPSGKIFELIDDVIFMNRFGRIVYWGPTGRVVNYFASHGYTCPDEYNPADYVMFLMQTLGESAVTDLAIAFEPYMQRTYREILELRRNPIPLEPQDQAGHKLTEFGLLVKREYKSTLRDYTVLILRLLIALFFGLLISFLLFQVGQNTPPGPLNPSHVGLVATLGIFAMVSSGQALLIAYANERPIMLREYASGLYSVAAYSLSKDVLEYPIVITVVLIYLTFGYLIGGLVGSFLLLLLGMILIGLSAAAISFLFAALTTTVAAGAQVGTYLLVLQVILSGFFIAVEQVPQVLRWIIWINPLRYGLSIMFLAEFNNQPGSTAFFAANKINPSMILFYIFMLIGLIVLLRIAGVVVLWYRSHKSVV